VHCQQPENWSHFMGSCTTTILHSVAKRWLRSLAVLWRERRGLVSGYDNFEKRPGGKFCNFRKEQGTSRRSREQSSLKRTLQLHSIVADWCENGTCARASLTHFKRGKSGDINLFVREYPYILLRGDIETQSLN
jgi:hypothetical protein